MYWRDTLASLDVLDHLHYAQGILTRYPLPGDLRSSLEERIRLLQQRYVDPNLYLAVVGEFNSGKSTLIDALLGDALLESGSVPTTAAATYLHAGPALDATVTLRGGPPLTFSRDRAALDQALALLDPALPAPPTTVRELIALATTRPAIAANVIRCDITHPAPFLASQTVIIDTPGVSSTDSQHGAVTQEVVAHQADLVMVTIPVFWQISLSFEAFLRETLRPFLPRAIFIITKGDEIEEAEELRRALAHIQKQIETRLEVANPQLFVVAARAALRQSTGDGSQTQAAEGQKWGIAFENVKQMLAQRLIRERTAATVEQIVRLLDDLMTDLAASLERQSQFYAEREQTIAREALPDYAAFFERERREGQQKISAQLTEAQRALEQEITRSRQQILDSAKHKIFSSSSRDILEAVVKTQIDQARNAELTLLGARVNSVIQTVSETGAQAEKTFRQRFDATFAALQRVAGAYSSPSRSLAVPGVATSIASPLQAANALIQKSKDTEAQVTYGAATAGAVIGTFIAPGIGTVIGGVVGALFGRLFRPSLDDQKSKVWQTVEPLLAQQMDAVKTSCRAALDAGYRQVWHQFDASVAACAAQYRAVYEAVRRQQDETQRELTAARAMLQRDRDILAARRAALQQRGQALLASLTTPAQAPLATTQRMT